METRPLNSYEKVGVKIIEKSKVKDDTTESRLTVVNNMGADVHIRVLVHVADTLV